MWKDFDPTPYSRAEFTAHVAKLRWTDWKPQGITLHNTAAPTLKQWVESGPAHDARISNLQHYYEQDLGWHQGPHLFISRNWINGFSSLLEPGVHSRCFNATHIGIEMVGDYNAEAFDTGDGALVRDNAVFAMATLFRAIGVNPSTLVFHVDCKIDNHDCPGKHVSKPDMIDRVIRTMFVLGPLAEAKASAAPLPAQPAPPEGVGQTDPLVVWKAIQTRLAALGFDPGPLDGDDGPKTEAALRAFAVSELGKL